MPCPFGLWAECGLEGNVESLSQFRAAGSSGRSDFKHGPGRHIDALFLTLPVACSTDASSPPKAPVRRLRISGRQYKVFGLRCNTRIPALHDLCSASKTFVNRALERCQVLVCQPVLQQHFNCIIALDMNVACACGDIATQVFRQPRHPYFIGSPPAHQVPEHSTRYRHLQSTS